MISAYNPNNGLLLAIGGGMELSTTNPIIKKFVELSGGENGIITVLPTASDYGDEVGTLYAEIFSKLSQDVKYFTIDKRKDAESSDLLKHLRNSTGIFLTGGNQLRITSLLGGSSAMKSLLNAHNSGVIIAGTSAGASAMSNTMISWGRSDIMVKGNLQMSPGMGLIRRMVIDSHFVKRGRISRLLHMVSLHPGILGIGLAEDTGILLESKNNFSFFEVIGSRQVIVVDGRDIGYSNMASLAENIPYTVTDVRVHVLGPHNRYDLNSHEVIYPKQIKESETINSPLFEVYDLPYRPNKFLTDEY